MGGDVVERQKRGGKKGLRRPKRRLSIRIDMTPMVDIAFLLLIFYMVSTVFAMPQAMEINLPPKDQTEDIEVKESNLLTIRVDGENRFWWNLKMPSIDNLPELLPTAPGTPDTVIYLFNGDTLRGLLTEQNRANNKLSTLILIHRDASYASMVNILDEVDLIERSWNAFTANELGVEIREIPKEQKFSYRYAMDKWADKDDRIISAAMNAGDEGGEL